MLNKINEELLWNKALELMPRGTQTMSKCPDQFVDGVYPKFAAKAKGAYITGLDGKKYLDFMCSLGPIILGYNNRKVNKAIRKQLAKGIIFSLPTLLEQELAQLIREVVPCGEQTRFCKNGTDANLASVRIARSYTGKEKILKAEGGYHGWGDWHAIDIRPYGVPSSLKNSLDSFKFNNLESLETLLKKDDVAAVIIEPQALTTPAPGFLQGVRDLCTRYKVVLIFDEVVTGFRWALGGAQEYFKVTPDLACMGKAVANGMPLGIITGKKEYMKELDHAFFSMTFGGECLSLAAAIATVQELRKKDYNYLWRLGNMFDKGIKEAAAKYDLNVNFAGDAMRHNLTFSDKYKDATGMKALFYQEMVKQGILFSNVLYIQFSHTEKDIRKTLKAADRAFNIVASNMNDLDKVLEGKRSVDIFRRST